MEVLVNDINTRNNNVIFDYKDLLDVEKFISPLGLYYLDHGGSNLCYLDSDPSSLECNKQCNVYKICKKIINTH